MYGAEIKSYSMERDGTESWVVISRGIERYVTECTLDHVDSTRDDTHIIGSERCGALRMQYQLHEITHTFQWSNEDGFSY